jgi:uncharacterized membrane protein
MSGLAFRWLRRERASAVVVTLLVFATALICIAALTVSARVVHARAQAQSAADAVALAAAYDGEVASARVAAANNVVIVRTYDDGDTVSVTVSGSSQSRV